ncbi:hypothetical protein JW899_04895 [Candidatus Uhrbacteria bacterium]|nr:hypothetical protein [Candidatus Uhrbacteria bacterium]
MEEEKTWTEKVLNPAETDSTENSTPPEGEENPITEEGIDEMLDKVEEVKEVKE